VLHDRPEVVVAFCTTHTHAQIGIQLGYSSMPWKRIRNRYGEVVSIGCSIHDHIQLEAAREVKANWCLYGHIYETRSKPGLPSRGITQLQSICRIADMPVIALGGITPQHISEIQLAGAAGVAILSPVWNDPEPIACIKRYRYALNRKEQVE
jgi:thiazole tautomerase (transcriptional regulator TenI)